MGEASPNDENVYQLVLRVQQGHHRAVLQFLRYGADPNSNLDFGIGTMTGLEYSVYRSDWRMAVIFFLHGADPNQHELTRVLQMFDHAAGYENPSVISLRQASSISAFEGLRALTEPEDSRSRAYLWLMEKCHNGNIDVTREFQGSLDSLAAAEQTFVRSHKVKSSIYTCLLCMRRKHLPQRAAKLICELVLLEVIHDFLLTVAAMD